MNHFESKNKTFGFTCIAWQFHCVAKVTAARGSDPARKARTPNASVGKSASLYSTPVLSVFCSITDGGASTYRIWPHLSDMARVNACQIESCARRKNLKTDFE